MLALSSPFIERLNEAYYLPDIPLGVVVATCNLVDCLPMQAHICLPGIFDEYPDLNTSQEREFGDFDVIDRRNGRRRWAWVLEDVQHLETPIPIKGGLGLWDFASDDGAADLVTEVLHGLVHAVRSGHVSIGPAKESGTEQPAPAPCICKHAADDAGCRIHGGWPKSADCNDGHHLTCDRDYCACICHPRAGGGGGDMRTL